MEWSAIDREHAAALLKAQNAGVLHHLKFCRATDGRAAHAVVAWRTASSLDQEVADLVLEKEGKVAPLDGFIHPVFPNISTFWDPRTGLIGALSEDVNLATQWAEFLNKQLRELARDHTTAAQYLNGKMPRPKTRTVIITSHEWEVRQRVREAGLKARSETLIVTEARRLRGYNLKDATFVLSPPLPDAAALKEIEEDLVARFGKRFSEEELERFRPFLKPESVVEKVSNLLFVWIIRPPAPKIITERYIERGVVYTNNYDFDQEISPLHLIYRRGSQATRDTAPGDMDDLDMTEELTDGAN